MATLAKIGAERRNRRQARRQRSKFKMTAMDISPFVKVRLVLFIR